MLLKLCRITLWAYVLSCVAAIAAVPLSERGMFGMAPDPLSGVFAVLFSLPWSMATSAVVGDKSPTAALAFMSVGMAANVLILRGLCGWLPRRPL